LPHAMVLETLAHFTYYRTAVDGHGGATEMNLAPEENSGIYYSQQNRHSNAWQVGTALSKFVSGWSGEHLIKGGVDLMQSRLSGDVQVRPVNILRMDGTLTRRQVSDPATGRFDATDIAAFAQDRWHVSGNLLLEYGLRVERDGVFGRVNVIPRLGAAIALDKDRNATIRGGWGSFYERTPLMAAAFPQLVERTETSYAADGQTPLGPPVVFRYELGRDLQTSRSATWNVGYEHRLKPWASVRANFLEREGRHELILDTAQQGSRGVITLASAGRSTYRDTEVGVHFARGVKLDIDLSYTHSRSTADLNDAYGYFLSLTADPILRPNAYGPTDTDSPNRFVGRGRATLGRDWMLELAGELRSGFPYSAVDEQLDFVGARNSLRFPTVGTVDASVEHRFRIGRFEPWIGVVFVNALNSFSPEDVQRNVASPAYGYFYSSPIRQVRITVHFHR
jgi:outer membrane receptor protein involved in Fe transport